LYPYAYVQADRKKHWALWELPDTCILFRRYLDSGKMINVYDWFESFAVVLESQREQLMEDKANGMFSPTKGKGKRKEIVDEDRNEVDEDKWKMEVHARFIRALHELDYLGFIKHTGRKADHVQRTVFDVPEA
jgi:origin recognition complex subunit 3